MENKISKDQKIINYIKTLGIDMINAAGSGHPGIVLGAAPIIYTLYAKHINVSANDVNWINRDRFVMSAGHGSALLYATLYMAGFNITIDDLKNFRRVGYKTPGHPEHGITPGVDMSTGPLGQGIASAVGMALGAKILKDQSTFEKENHLFAKEKALFDYHVYVLCGDGDLMEGIANEAASLAGNLHLNNLIVLYDSNGISLDGNTDNTFTENVVDRFKALGWNAELVKDGEDVKAIDQAISRAKTSNKPTIIEVKTVIGRGTSLAGTSEVHGKLLSKEDNEQLKRLLHVVEEPFVVPEDVIHEFRKMISERSSKKYDEWAQLYKKFKDNATLGSTNNFNYLFNSNISIDLNQIDWHFSSETKEATRITNGNIMTKLASEIPNFIGGSADLASSAKTYLNKQADISKDNYNGRNIWFGVREHVMGAVLNGLALTGFRPFGSTFLAFADYIKPAIRMSAIMDLPVTYIFSHDSINIGQDGPTHQPIEQLAMLRSTPNLNVFRPADPNELVGCWNSILNSNSPNCLILSRADVNLLPTTNGKLVEQGAYVVRKEKENIHGIIIATGSEVPTALYLANELYNSKKLDIRVVSMPCMELFLKQSEDYQELILPKGYKKIVIEAGSSFGWHRFVYSDKYLITIDKFGVSGTKDEVLDYCDFTYNKIKDKVEKLLK
jgi:transketolase